MEMVYLRKVTLEETGSRILLLEVICRLKQKSICSISRLRWIGHRKRMPDARVSGGRGRGSPRHTWEKVVREAIKKRGIDWSTINELTVGKNTWKRLYKKEPDTPQRQRRLEYVYFFFLLLHTSFHSISCFHFYSLFFLFLSK